jgi:hypothetical protein
LKGGFFAFITRLVISLAMLFFILNTVSIILLKPRIK